MDKMWNCKFIDAINYIAMCFNLQLEQLFYFVDTLTKSGDHNGIALNLQKTKQNEL